MVAAMVAAMVAPMGAKVEADVLPHPSVAHSHRWMSGHERPR
jgi:hypothetical protein